MEWARTNKNRGLLAAWPQFGGPAGLFLAHLAVLFFSWFPVDQFLVWRYRIPFLLSIVMVGIGLWIRLRITETLREKASRAAPRSTRRSRRHCNSLGDRDEARVEARGTAFPLSRFPPLHGSRSGSPISAPVDQISETVPYGRCYQ
jgi:MFS family permease